MEIEALTELEYRTIRELLYKLAGISLGPNKKTLVTGRLFKRLQTLQLRTYGEYFERISSGKFPEELQIAINLLTTNETYFFREAKHFAMLEELFLKAHHEETFRVWSAACSTGEEVYTIAITLQEASNKRRCAPWEVRGSDISTRVLDVARAGLYSQDRTEGIPPEVLKRYFLYGTGPYEGKILVERPLRERAEFAQINLIDPLPELVPFDVIFLRNVMIYFDNDTKRKVVAQLLANLKPEGVLFIGLAESLNGLIDGLVNVGPGAYRRDRRR
ncbi:CheR family methyltransferase [Massilia sp. W12]|uniref:CheR family methyltransferase n=1 Tax=Massilia sp. W12 TaxID=3126507 RepID=UPI0030CE77FF